MSVRTIQDSLDANFSLSITFLPTNETVSFSAYLTNFQDSYNQSWTEEEVYGRMDPIYLYKNTKRKISLSIDIPSEDELQGQLNFRKISKLIKFSYPVYQKAKIIPLTIEQISKSVGKTTAETNLPSGNSFLLSTPPLIAVKFANFIRSNNASNKLIGKINEVSYKTDADSGYFASNGKLYTMIYKLDLNLDVLHTDPLGWEKDGQTINQRTRNFPYGV